MSAPPHSHPLKPSHDAALALAVATQVFAVSHASPWLSLGWSTSLAIALGLAVWLPTRARRLIRALLVHLVTSVGALVAVGCALGAPVFYPHLFRQLIIVIAGCVVWAIHAPLTMTRAWLRARPSHDAALELAEAVGWSLVATAFALTSLNRAWAWSMTRGTVWSTGACVVLGIAALAWSWRAHARRRRWMRDVIGDRDATWQVVESDATTTAPAWTYAHEGTHALRLTSRAAEAHYREVNAGTDALAKVASNDARAWWTRRALHTLTAFWVAAGVIGVAPTLLHLGPNLPSPASDPEREVTRLLSHGLVVAPMPCELRERARPSEGHRVFEYSEGGGRPTTERAEVWSSGRLVLSFDGSVASNLATGHREWRHWMAVRCIAPSAAARWIDDLRPSDMIARQAIHTLRAAPRADWVNLPDREACVAGEWCALGWHQARTAERPAAGYGVDLDANGRFLCFNEQNETTGGTVDARDARALLRAVRELSELRGIAEPDPSIDGFARVRVSRQERPLYFVGAERVWEGLRRRLCVTR